MNNKCSCAIVENVIITYQNKGNACIVVLYSNNFSVPLCNISNMLDHSVRLTSPFNSILIFNTPWAAGCCGPKFK